MEVKDAMSRFHRCSKPTDNFPGTKERAIIQPENGVTNEDSKEARKKKVVFFFELKFDVCV